MDIYLLKADKPFSEYEHLLKYALPERQERISRLKNEADKSVSLLSHLFARFEISLLTHKPFSDISFKYNEYGKPYIEKDNFHFSTSHTKNIIAFTAHSCPIGIDIEQIVKKDDYPALRFFTESEKEYINCDSVRFFEIWTQKEAYVKMLGTGLSKQLTSFDVTDDNFKKMLSSVRYEDYIISICTKDISFYPLKLKTIN